MDYMRAEIAVHALRFQIPGIATYRGDAETGDYYPTERALEQSAVALRDMLIEFSRVQARLSCPSSSRIGLSS